MDHGTFAAIQTERDILGKRKKPMPEPEPEPEPEPVQDFDEDDVRDSEEIYRSLPSISVCD